MGDFKEPTALFKKSRGISPVLAACPILDALITQIPEEPLRGSVVFYAIYNLFNFNVKIDVVVGDVVCDPMCGGGSIPIEGALCWPTSVHLCGDHHDLAPPRTLANVENVNKEQYTGK